MARYSQSIFNRRTTNHAYDIQWSLTFAAKLIEGNFVEGSSTNIFSEFQAGLRHKIEGRMFVTMVVRRSLGVRVGLENLCRVAR